MGRVRTIQRTAKTWKAMQGLGCMATAIGGVLLWRGISGAAEDPHGPGPMLAAGGILALVLGLPAWLFGRLGAWWWHG